ncbi:MAG: hypothetical protein KGL35_06715 [Bradyrhizobium sp.]|nr:hypothetical protein [Bradyrhizobium sp.]
MTTVAWDGKMLAADRRATSQGMAYEVCKLHRTPDGRLLAGAGYAGLIGRMFAWLDNPERDWNARPAEQASDDYVFIIEITTAAEIRLHGRYGEETTTSPFTASGSGRDYAMAAMACGKTAAEAVEIAARFDIGTGGGVDTLTLGA